MLIATRFLRLALDAAGGSMRVSPWRPQSSARGSWPLWSGMEAGDPSRGTRSQHAAKGLPILGIQG